MCEANVVPNEFFPHHGSGGELRERLKPDCRKNLPTPLFVLTLELGIDIGKVQSVA